MRTILALDLDGTIVEKLNPVHPEMAAFLKEFYKQGIIVSFVTGRMFSFANYALKEIDFPYILALQNGADILQMPGKKLLKRNYLSLNKLIDRLKTIQIPYILYSGVDSGDFSYYQKNLFTKDQLTYLNELKKISSKPWVEYTSIEEVAHLSFPLVKFFGLKEDLLPLEDVFSDFSARVIQDSVDPAQSILLLTAWNANKGGVVAFLRDQYRSKQVIAAGDERNDIPLFLAADYSIAMPHAPYELKEIADEVVEINLKESLKKFLT